MLAKEYRLCEKQVKKALQFRKPFFGEMWVMHALPSIKWIGGGFAIILSGKQTRWSVNRNFFRRRFYDHIRQNHSDLLDGKYMIVMSFKKGTLFSSKEEASIALFDKSVADCITKFRKAPPEIQKFSPWIRRNTSPSTTAHTK